MIRNNVKELAIRKYSESLLRVKKIETLKIRMRIFQWTLYEIMKRGRHKTRWEQGITVAMSEVHLVVVQWEIVTAGNSQRRKWCDNLTVAMVFVCLVYVVF